MSYGIILIKILPVKYASEFLDGNIYFNTDEFFTKIDSNDLVRSDVHEGIDESRQVQSIAIANDLGEYIPIGGIINPVTFRYGNKDKINILCMYGYNNKVNTSFDTVNLSFGDTSIIITDAKAFISRLQVAANKLGKTLNHGPIEYVDKEKYDGAMGPFKKFNSHKEQNEFRFVLSKSDGEPIKLNIGDIRDITMVSKTSEIKYIPKNLSLSKT